jgi:hypothetical protein
MARPPLGAEGEGGGPAGRGSNAVIAIGSDAGEARRVRRADAQSGGRREN